MAKVSKKSKSQGRHNDIDATMAEIEAIRNERIRSQNLIRTLVRLYRLCYAVPSAV